MVDVPTRTRRLRDFTYHLLIAKLLAFNEFFCALSDYLVDMLIREMKEAEQCGLALQHDFITTNGFICGDVKINVTLRKKI